MMARRSNAPSIGRIQKRKTNFSKSSLSAYNARPKGDIHVAAKHALTYRKSRGAKGSGVGLDPRRVASRRMNWVLSHAAFIRSDLASR